MKQDGENIISVIWFLLLGASILLLLEPNFGSTEAFLPILLITVVVFVAIFATNTDLKASSTLKTTWATICKLGRKMRSQIIFIVFAVSTAFESLIPAAKETLAQVSHFFPSPKDPKDPDENNQSDFLISFLKAYNNSGCNTCLGLLFQDENPIEFYLAFSNEKNDRVGDKFQTLSNEKLPHIYCKYSGEELYKMLRIKTWDTNLKPLDISLPEFKQLGHRQKKAQTCAERKVIAKVRKNHIQFNSVHHLVLFTKYAPCEYCLSLIQEINNESNLGLEVHVICIDFLRWLKDNEKNLGNIDEILNYAEEILSATDTSATKTKLDKQKDKLCKIAEEQAQILINDNISTNSIKKVIEILSKHNDNVHLTADEITSLILTCCQKGGQL